MSRTWELRSWSSLAADVAKKTFTNEEAAQAQYNKWRKGSDEKVHVRVVTDLTEEWADTYDRTSETVKVCLDVLSPTPKEAKSE